MPTVITRGDRIFQALDALILGLIGVICLFPFVNVLAKSLSGEQFVVAGRIWLWPMGFTTGAYRYLLGSQRLWSAMRNTIYITVVGTLLNTAMTVCVSYAVSRKFLVGRSFIQFLYVFTMLFGGGLIPTYLIVKAAGLIDRLEALYIPGLVSAFNMILLRNYFNTIPDSLEESAKLDGAGNVTIMLRILAPLAMPSIATVALFGAVGLWNTYFAGIIYITKRSMQPLQVFLRDAITATNDINMSDWESLIGINTESIRGATVIVATVPILLVYPFLQRYFVTGMTVGAVKQ